MAICLPAGTLASYADFYRATLGLVRYSSEYVDFGGHAMDSVVMRSPSGGITFTLVAPDPAKGPGQLDAFLDRNAGPGVQRCRGPGRAVGRRMRREDLHGSVSDPVLDTMNFLNEITHRYPDVISFAPGRPYDGFFEVDQVFSHIRRYLGFLADRGTPADRIRDTGVLRDYGNLSSCSFLFSDDRLVREQIVAPGDYGVLMTMDPGSTIESALIRW